MKKFFIVLFVAIAGLGSMSFIERDATLNSFITPDAKCTNLDFVLINKTGYDISDIYVAPTTEREWGEDIMGQDILENGESVEISFDSGETAHKWDMYVTWDGYEADHDVFWIGLDLSKISEIELYYDANTGKTWAKTK